MRKAAAGVVLALLALVLTGCQDNTATGTSGFPAGNGAADQIPVARRSEPISLSGPTLSGGTLDIASLRGQVVVLNVWGSWCAPCRKEARALVDAQKELSGGSQTSGTKVSFVGINTRDDYPAQAIAFEKNYGVTYPSLVDDGGNLLLSLRGAVPPQAIPTTLVLDPQGRIAARFLGGITKTTLVDLVSDVTGATPSISKAQS